MPLKPKQEAFVREYLTDLNATEAAVRAGYSPKTAAQIGYQLLQKTSVQSALSARMKDRADRLKLTADDALRRLWAVASADPNELVEYRRTCCRFCHGGGHRYQHTPAEQGRRVNAWKAAVEKAVAAGKPRPDPFDPEGGADFDARRDPHPDCPECFGEGEGRVHLKDTRHLSPEARALYAGVKETRDGAEVKTHDQLAALMGVGKHLGLFAGDEGGAAGNHLHLHLSAQELRKLPPDELRRLYREALRAPEAPDDEAPPRP